MSFENNSGCGTAPSLCFNFAVLDDLDREKKQKDKLVGSLNAANKFTIGRGKMQKLSGLIITKNIEPSKQKMPSKVDMILFKTYC